VKTYLDLERVAAAHWRGTEEEWLGDWLLRAADGFTGRANSALPLGDPGLPLEAALAKVTRWYRHRGLPPMIVIPVPSDGDAPARRLDDELARRGWATRKAPAFVMVADLPPYVAAAAAAAGGGGGGGAAGAADGPRAAVPPGRLSAGLVLRADPAPDDAWLAAYHYRGLADQPPVMRTVLTSAAEQLFVSIRTAGTGLAAASGVPAGASVPGGKRAAPGSVVAIARLSLAGGWAGITAVEVTPEYRRAGLGSALTRELLASAAAHAVSKVFLQVEVDNEAARRLYERAGFHYSHRYHYRVAPLPASEATA
jgi:ribosomal protein S18 acetylase RimI-like enzyme